TGPDPVILRVGGITEEGVTRVTGRAPARRDDGTVAAPGTLPSHYAPDARVELVASDEVTARVQELLDQGVRVGVLALDPPRNAPSAVVVLDAPSDVDDYGRVLYARLREADRIGLAVVLVVPPPAVGVGVAVVDR